MRFTPPPLFFLSPFGIPRDCWRIFSPIENDCENNSLRIILVIQVLKGFTTPEILRKGGLFRELSLKNVNSIKNNSFVIVLSKPCFLTRGVQPVWLL